MQNKIHYAIHGHTAAELIVARADAEKEFMGLLTFKGNHPTLIEAKTAKKYLNEKELRAMGQLVSGYLEFAERQAEREQVMTMNDWAAYLDRILTMSGEQLLQGSGSVSHEEAMEHATMEYRKYKQRTLSDVERDYLFSIKSIEDSVKKKNYSFNTVPVRGRESSGRSYLVRNDAMSSPSGILRVWRMVLLRW